jgi:hypothetical protein
VIETIAFTRHGKGRIWLNELPDAAYAALRVLQSIHDGMRPLVHPATSAAVEIYSPRGGRAITGLLGARFEPSDDERLIVEVAVSSGNGSPISWPFASTIDEMYAGLPLEYAHAIAEPGLPFEILRSLGSGRLRFDRAAHGAVGSSPALFRCLASAVAQLICAGAQRVPEAVLVELLRKTVAF